jgi:hypothetical protein
MSQETVHENYEVWKAAELSKTFLEGVRGAIPLAPTFGRLVNRGNNICDSWD